MLKIIPGETERIDEVVVCTVEYVSLVDKPESNAHSLHMGQCFYDEG